MLDRLYALSTDTPGLKKLRNLLPPVRAHWLLTHIPEQVDRGASLSWISQYSDEEEILFPPLSNLEVIGDPKLEAVNGVTVTMIPIRINANTKCLTLDELISR